MRNPYVLCSLFLVLAGCAADNNARELSRLTLAQVVSYEDSVRKLSRTLSNHYGQTAEDLSKDLQQGAKIDRRLARWTDAEEAAIDAMKDGGLTPPRLRDFISSSLKSDKERVDEINAEIAALRAGEKQSVAQLEVKEDRLKSVRHKLEKLQAEPGLTSYLNRLKPLFDTAKAAFEKSEETVNEAQ
jgi:type I site-specific restriction endonuclease